MKIYKTTAGIILERKDAFYVLEQPNWDHFINDDALFQLISFVLLLYLNKYTYI